MPRAPERKVDVSMTADLDAPSAPFVIITRKGGFPAATLAEAQRLIRPLVTDPKACVTDAKGRKYTPRDFLAGCDRAAQPAEPGPRDIKDWAAATADIDLEAAPPPGWPPAAPVPALEAGNPARSSARLRTPASTRSSANMPAARRAPTSDRRQVSERRGRDDGGGGIPPLVIVLIIAVIVMGGVILAVIGNRSARSAMTMEPPPSTAPVRQAPPSSPTRPDGTVRPEDRPLPTYMQ